MFILWNDQQFPNCIVTINTQGDRIVVGDIQESVHFASYRHHDNRIIIFADDTVPRWITTTTLVDYDTIIGGDKFGNIFADRLPSDVSKEVDDDPTGNKVMFEKGYLQGAANKVLNAELFHTQSKLIYYFAISFCFFCANIYSFNLLLFFDIFCLNIAFPYGGISCWGSRYFNRKNKSCARRTRSYFIYNFTGLYWDYGSICF